MKSSITVLLSIGQQNDHFQEIACIRFQRSYTVQCHEILWILGKLTIFSDLHEIFHEITDFSADWTSK